ncbi:MAG: FAD-dependent oxidoreductase [Clostridia bacterium]|nr:FAD-dependent oxidoreductase [Clostridia bacterium]
MSMKADVVIIGAGPAGLTAGIFTSRAGLKTICVEALAVGGQASLTYEITNYPGFKSISGFDLTSNMAEQARACGVQLEYGKVESLTKSKTGFEVKTKHETFEAEKVIVACGSKVRKLNLSNEEKLTGHGISYCASCDGSFFKGKNVAVVGGGNTAFADVIYLSKLAKKVYLINRSERYRGNKTTFEKIKKMPNVEILSSSVVEGLRSTDVLTGIEVNTSGVKKELSIEGLFIAIGYEANFDFVKFNVETDENGYIKVNEDKQTSVKNLFACGDATSKKFKQVITACADGAIAGNSCVGA